MSKTLTESSSRACFRVRCCALGSIVQVSVLGLRKHSRELGLNWEELSNETRTSWMSLVEMLELAPDETSVEKLLLEAAKSRLGVALGTMESCLAARGRLPWSCQSKPYMRLASATYAPLSLDSGDLFSAYCLYFESLRRRLSPWLDNEDPEVMLNSILVIARNEYQTLERRLNEAQVDITYIPLYSPPDVMRVAQQVPQCPLCGQLMERDENGDWSCEKCQIKDASYLM